MGDFHSEQIIADGPLSELSGPFSLRRSRPWSGSNCSVGQINLNQFGAFLAQERRNRAQNRPRRKTNFASRFKLIGSPGP
jgi:hypothetical protein